MLLVKFDLEDLEKCKTVSDVYRAMGIGVNEDDPQDLNLYNKEVFGKKAYYKNIFMTESTYNKVTGIMEAVDGKKDGKNAFNWFNFGPVTNGSRYEMVKEAIGELNDSVLYIVTPEDDMYEESPETKK